MKKIYLLLLTTIILFSGCQTIDRGMIDTSKNIEVYYYKTEYIDETFYILSDNTNNDGTHTVTFTTDAEIDFGDGIYTESIKPNTIIEYTFSQDTYEQQINGMEVFETSLTAYTFVFPADNSAKYCTYVDFNDSSVSLIANNAINQTGLEQPFNENYIKQWRFNWIKI